MEGTTSTNLFGFPDGIPDKKKLLVPKKPKLYKRRIDMATLESILCSIPTVSDYGIPQISPNNYTEIPSKLVGLDAISKRKDLSDICCHFFEDDYRFIRVLDHPDKYLSILKRCMYVISPDFSQRIGWAKFACFSNSCWGKALGAYWQLKDANIIPNVTWTTSSSYEYNILGLPTRSMIAINSTGCSGSDLAKYVWHQGYSFMTKRLNPTIILRYGPKMQYEDESISVYYQSEHIKRMRHGS